MERYVHEKGLGAEAKRACAVFHTSLLGGQVIYSLDRARRHVWSRVYASSWRSKCFAKKVLYEDRGSSFVCTVR